MDGIPAEVPHTVRVCTEMVFALHPRILALWVRCSGQVVLLYRAVYLLEHF